MATGKKEWIIHFVQGNGTKKFLRFAQEKLIKVQMVLNSYELKMWLNGAKRYSDLLDGI